MAWFALLLGSLTGAGIASYVAFREMKAFPSAPNLLINTVSTSYYSSPSNGDRWFYEYPFDAHTLEQIYRETDGYLMPLLSKDGKYYILDCPNYHFDESCSGDLLQHYTSITRTSRNVQLWNTGNPMNTKFNNTTVFSCLAEHPPASFAEKIFWLIFTAILTLFAVFVLVICAGVGFKNAHDMIGECFPMEENTVPQTPDNSP